MPETPRRPIDPPIALRSLAPSYDEKQHGIYITALVGALRETEDVRNIALTGAYGTGKSSVLKHLTELGEFKDRVLELSLSTVGVTERRPEGDSDTNPAAWTKSNLIQKEIVKQILYRDPPAKTRGSRFRRISRFRWAPAIGTSLGVGLLLLAILWITGLATKFTGALGKDPVAGWVVAIYIALLVVLSGIVYATRWLTHNRVFLEKLSAGPATVSLAATSSSYFDQYMDEIVYYFEQSGRDIVVFEDIDRFEDVHIFETLRALNTLLNGSEQVRRRRRVGEPKPPSGAPMRDVKFIYALRDSVFEKLGDSLDDDADDEVNRANRTKFFDIVIPIVPFITHRNARDLMLHAMDGTGVSRELINVAAGFVADMRLITNMRNEYDIYANRLLGTTNQMPGLDSDRLFALVIYKCVHMADFEAIRFGNSNLDALHDAWREIVKDSLTDAYERERTASKQLALDGVTDARARSLGNRIELVAHAITPNQNYTASTYISIGGQQHRGEDLRQAAFWSRLAESEASIAIANGQLGMSVSMTRQQLQTLMGQSLDPVEWKQLDRRADLQARQSARNEIAFLRHHEWGAIHGHQEFTTRPGGGDGETFAKATTRILRSRLARALVAAGYINEYFALYVSVYYGEHLRPRALNYVIHTLDRGVSDIRYQLDEEDVEAIIGDKGIDIFRDRAAYNISILDHLLAKRPEEAELIVRQIAAWDGEDRAFGEAYIQAGQERVKFIQRLAPLMPNIIASILTEAPEEDLAQLIDAALDYAGGDIGDNSEFNSLVVENYDKFPSISSAAKPKSKIILRKHKTIDAIAKLGIQLPLTAPLTAVARERAIELGTYELNAANITDLTGQPSLALDSIRAKCDPVFNTALGRIAEYLALVNDAPDAVSVADADAFTSILNHAHQSAVDDHYLSQIARCASDECRVGDFNDAPQSVWPTLAATKRITPSARNLLLYLDSLGALDENVGALLTGVTAIDEPDAVPDGDRVRLAVAMLAARQTIPSATHRVELAASLGLPSLIPATSLTPEPGVLVGLMIEANLIQDDETTFASILISDWPTREAALIKSKNASAFLSLASLPSAHLGSFFRSTKVPTPLKEVAISNLLAFVPGADKDAIHAMATFAAASRADLTFAMIDQLRVGGASDLVIASLLSWSSTASLEEIRAELRALGAPYPLVADRGTARPLIPDDEAHRRLLDRLKEVDIVSDHKPDRGGRRVSLRKP